MKVSFDPCQHSNKYCRSIDCVAHLQKMLRTADQTPIYMCAVLQLERLNQAKIVKKSVILFWLLNRTIGK